MLFRDRKLWNHIQYVVADAVADSFAVELVGNGLVSKVNARVAIRGVGVMSTHTDFAGAHRAAFLLRTQ